jgi:hypothetical protein
MDAIKNFIADGYTDTYELFSDDNPIQIRLRNKWLNNQVLHCDIVQFTSGFGSTDPSVWISPNVSFVQLQGAKITPFQSGYNANPNSSVSGIKPGVVMLYDTTKGRHHFMQMEHDAYVPNTAVYLRDPVNDYISILFTDENGANVTFPSNYYLSMTVTYGKVNLTL